MSDSARLKKLQTLESEAKEKLNIAKETQREASRQVNDASNELREIKQEIRELTVGNPTIVVSEHAMLRYFERVLGFDLEEIKAQIIPPQTQKQIEHFQGGTFPVQPPNPSEQPEFKVRVKNNTVVTVLTHED